MSRPFSIDSEGDSENPAGIKNFDINDPKDWAVIVEKGWVWSVNDGEIQNRAFEDLATGRLPLNDNIPDYLREVIDQKRGQA